MATYTERLEELINDEDKIVTVSSFARDQNIPINETRDILSKYAENNKTLGVTYFVNGKLKNGKSTGVFYIKSEDLGRIKDVFEGEPKKCIHSIQKSNNVDYNVVALIDKFSENNINDKPLLGSVVGENCVKRQIKKKVLPPPPVPVVKGKSALFAKHFTKSEEKPKDEKEKVAEPQKTEQKAKPQNNIASMFSKAAASKQTTSNEISNNNNKKLKPNAGLTSFLSRGNSSNSSNGDTKKNGIKKEEKPSSEESKLPSSSECSENIVSSEDFAELMDFEEQAEKPEEKKKEIEKPVEKKKEVQEKKKTKRTRSKSKEKSAKRRKRIVEIQDSDSDDIFGSDKEAEDIIEKSDEERPPSPVAKKVLQPKNKRRKLVERTYEDDEGFILTKHEYVSASASEGETEEPAPKKEETKKEPPKIEKKNSSSPENEVAAKTGGKKNKKEPNKNQPTMFQFFKRK